MGRDTGGFREKVRLRLRQAGAVAVGFSEAGPVPQFVTDAYQDWIDRGKHSGMEYMLNHREVRADARNLLEGARTVISMAFSYGTDAGRAANLPHVSKYALFPDYHKWIKRLVWASGVGELLGKECLDWRLCIDSAPIFERYYASKGGVGFIGRNGSLIVPGVGAEVFLAEIVTVREIEADGPCTMSCRACGACLKACPTGALGEDGTIDCDRCISYLTIEHRGQWKEEAQKEAMLAPAGRNTLFGCDRCVSVCPHNNPDVHAEVGLHPEMLTFAGTQPPAGSCLKRAKEEGLRRNLFFGTDSPGSVAVELRE